MSRRPRQTAVPFPLSPECHGHHQQQEPKPQHPKEGCPQNQRGHRGAPGLRQQLGMLGAAGLGQGQRTTQPSCCRTCTCSSGVS